VSDESLELLGLILGCIGKSRGKEERLFWTDHDTDLLVLKTHLMVVSVIDYFTPTRSSDVYYHWYY
jgi:hypothetical protein